MSASAKNKLNNNEGKTQGSGNQVLVNPQQNFVGGPTVALEVSKSVKSLNY